MADINKVKELMEGAIDVHIHTGPDVFPRLVNDIEAANQAKEAGMKAILIKNHMTCTADRAQIASHVVGIPVYGGIALNLPIGGINPQAVDAALRMGAKEVWMPTLHADAYLADGSHVPMFNNVLQPGLKGINILDENGNLKKEVLEVLALIAEKKAILGTGHISIKEAMVLVPQAKKMGIDKIIVTHPLSTMLNYTINDLKEILEKGAAMIEHNINDTTHQMKHPIKSELIANAIMVVGADTAIMSTDGGQVINPRPVEMMENFISQMLDLGISEKDIITMVRENPARMLEI
ncbi:MAG: DUF6282 family protein [Tepidanaerobacteraceae bacterium]|nr:DUF6282 family protein [Tepidanaerobacteraceae bacterium]